jgi:hypothetical protein
VFNFLWSKLYLCDIAVLKWATVSQPHDSDTDTEFRGTVLADETEILRKRPVPVVLLLTNISHGLM